MKPLGIPLALALAATPGLLHAQTISGSVELSFGQLDYFNSDDNESDDIRSLGAAAHVGLSFGNWRATLDANHLERNVDDQADFKDEVPEGATAYGLHVGRTFGATYVGVFAGINEFQGLDSGSSNGSVDGELYGLELEHQTSFGSVFGQIGKAEMIGQTVNGAEQTGFDGEFVMMGVAANIGKGTAYASLELGRSPDLFEDPGDEGVYHVIDLEYEHPFGERVIGSVGVQLANFDDNSDVERGGETTFSVGLRVPFGSDRTRNNLKTTYSPGLAAAWAESLG